MYASRSDAASTSTPLARRAMPSSSNASASSRVNPIRLYAFSVSHAIAASDLYRLSMTSERSKSSNVSPASGKGEPQSSTCSRHAHSSCPLERKKLTAASGARRNTLDAQRYAVSRLADGSDDGSAFVAFVAFAPVFRTPSSPSATSAKKRATLVSFRAAVSRIKSRMCRSTREARTAGGWKRTDGETSTRLGIAPTKADVSPVPFARAERPP